MKVVKVFFTLILLFVVSCSSKEPEYDLGPRRSPQDNQGIIQGMQNKQQQVPAPPIPGYDIPAPRYNSNPRMIDAPNNFVPTQPSIMQPQQVLPQSFVPQPMNNATSETRRRPVKQFSGAPLPHALQIASAMPTRPIGYQPAPVREPKKKLSFFDRIKNLFRKEKPKREPKRVPAGQGHLVGAGASFGYGDPIEPRGAPVPVESGLDEELKDFPQTPAERAADDNSVWIPPENIKENNAVAIKSSSKQVSVENSVKGLQFKLKTPEDWIKGSSKKGATPVSVSKQNPVLQNPKSISPVSIPYDEIEQRWKEQQLQNDGKTLWESKKIDENKLKAIPEDIDQTEVDAIKAKISNAVPEEAEVLMEFDISEEGELVNISDIAPAAGKEDAAAR